MLKRLTAILSPSYRAIDWFIPVSLRTDAATLGRARIFVFSHLFGPTLGQSISIYLWILDPQPSLAFVAVEDLTFVTLFGSYHYGGVSSPFLPWLLNALLLAFFYLGDRPRLRYGVLFMFALNLLGFYVAYAAAGMF